MQEVEIIIKGRIDEDWSEWFEGFVITYHEKDETVLTGSVTDQAELYGLLARIRDLGLSLVSLRHRGSNGEENCSSDASVL
jgi:hypothetical protein